MPNGSPGGSDERTLPRLALPAMYTLVRIRPGDHERFRWTGHIYDISETGMRFELDAPVEPGTDVVVRAMLPGVNSITVTACGRIVRLHDEEGDCGPTRMGLAFTSFASDIDAANLRKYLIDHMTQFERVAA